MYVELELLLCSLKGLSTKPLFLGAKCYPKHVSRPSPLYAQLRLALEIKQMLQ